MEANNPFRGIRTQDLRAWRSEVEESLLQHVTDRVMKLQEDLSREIRVRERRENIRLVVHVGRPRVRLLYRPRLTAVN